MLTCQRDRFSLPDDVHYLNCAYMGPLPDLVEEAGLQGLRRKRAPTELLPEDFFTDGERLRGLFARLIGARRPDRVAILPSVSYGIAVVARNTETQVGQNIVVVEDQFPSNVYAWRTLAAERGLTIRTVARPCEGPPCARQWNESVLEAIDGDTAIVALPHVHWTDGSLFALDEIGQAARRHGAALIVDGSQSVGALPFDVGTIQPDAMICAGYKWLLGPYSLCLGYFGERYDGGRPLEETWIARRGSDDFQHLVDYCDEYQKGATRYDVGERSNFILVPMMIAALELILEWDPVRIQQYCRDLLGDLTVVARDLSLPVEDSDWRGEHILGVRLPAGLQLDDLQARLAARKVYASLRGDALRVSPNVYNDPGDVGELIRVLREMVVAA